MLQNLLTTLLVLFLPQEIPETPDSAVTKAVEWMKQEPEKDFTGFRFFSGFSIPKEGFITNPTNGETATYSPQDHAAEVLIWATNQVNLNNPAATFTTVAPGLFAINIASPGWDHSSWESLAADNNTYFHPAWINTENWNYLVQRTGSSAPIMQTEEFVTSATLGNDYYNLLFGYEKVKTATELKQVLGVQQDVLYAQNKIRAAVVTTGLTVTAHPRRLERWPGLTPLWISYDTNDEGGQKDALAQYASLFLSSGKVVANDPHNFDFDGQEYIFPLSNSGGWGTFLNGKDGKRVAEVPIEIAPGEDNFKDRRVRAGRSCFGCHVTMIKPFKSDLQLLFESGLKVRASDSVTGYILKTVYDNFSLERQAELDKQQYLELSQHYLGIDPTTISDKYRRLYIAHVETEVDLARAAREAGVTEEEMFEIVKQSDEPTLKLLNLRDVKKNPKTISVKAWKFLYPEVMILQQVRNGSDKATGQTIFTDTTEVTCASPLALYDSDLKGAFKFDKAKTVDGVYKYPLVISPVDGVYPTWLELRHVDKTVTRYKVETKK